MNARVFLLVLVTGSFMLAWNGDQSAMKAAIVRRDQARELRIAALNRTVSNLSTFPREPEANAPGATEFTAQTTLESSVPLPADLPAGVYQAVSQSGMLTRIVVTEANSTSAVARDFYLSDDSEGNRWYLVRLNRP